MPTSRTVHLRDALSDKLHEIPTAQETCRRDGVRTQLAVPMLREGEAIGAIVLRRAEVNPFTDKQLASLQTFADQAVIAIENVRLFDEVQAKTRDLTESLQQQTATADVLKVISRSAFDLETVLDALLSSACRLCEADIGTIRYKEGGEFRLAATFGCKPEWIEHFQRYSTKPDRSSVFGRTIVEGHIVHIPDLLADPDFKRPEAQKLMGFKAALGVPLAREGEAFGVISLFRFNVSSFEDRQIELVQTFADQAVIAIENARLFNETKEALERQTATADILKVIASSPSDVQPVFRAIAESARRLLGGRSALVTRVVGDKLDLAAHTAGSEAGNEALRGLFPTPLTSSDIHSKVARTGAVEFRADIEADPDVTPTMKELGRMRGYRSIVAVPMMLEGTSIGTIGVSRREPGPFADNHIDLLKTFADQAVIAIENVRLFNETREALERQTATAEVLKVISRSSVDLETVLDTLVGTVARLCRADQAFMYRRHADGLHHLIARHGLSEEAKAYLENNPFAPDRGTTSGRVALERRPIHIPDVLADPDYTYMGGQLAAGFRTLLGLPLLREDTLIGVFVIGRTRVDPFTNKEIELATSLPTRR